MTPTNSHPGTAARGMRRAFLLQAACGLLTALLATPAHAQGVIQFSLSSYPSFTRYQVKDDGTGLKTLGFPQSGIARINATTRSDYTSAGQKLRFFKGLEVER